MGPRAIMEATNNHDDLKYLKRKVMRESRILQIAISNVVDSATGRAVPKETGSKCWP
jgi:hypothetical protein